MTTLAAALLARLRAHGVEVVFGIPGVHTAELYRGLAETGIRHVTPRHEQGAGFMADGYARMTGRPGVCFVITGPGLSNIATAMLQARGDSIPMLVISGVNNPGRAGEGHLHEMPDQAAFAAQCACTTRTIGDPAELAGALDDAFDLFSSSRPGPVHIQIPLSLMRAPCTVDIPLRPARLAALPAQDKLEAVREIIAESAQPVIIAGGGARHAARSAIALAEALDCPTIPTINCRQGFAPNHPLVVPASLSFDAIRDSVEASDLVFAFGTEFGPTDYDVYATGRRFAPRRLIRVDIDAAKLARGPAATFSLQGDAGVILAWLLQHVPARRPSDGTLRADVLRKATRTALGPVYERYVGLLEAMRDLAPEAVFVGDSTQLVYAGNMYFAPGTGGGWFNSSSGFGTLGYALPAALGAKIARPQQTVVALIGDGGAQFTLGEFGTLRDLGLKIIVIVWNNHGYGEIRSYMNERTIEPQGVDLTPPDFALLAKSYGLDAIVSEGEAGLMPAFAAALDRSGPVVIEVRGVD